MEGGTLQEWGGRRTVMETLPAMDCYEDMFKEITRKLYGEEAALQDVEEHVTHGTRTDYDVESPESGHGAFTAFGLAALMQNGFPPPHGMFSHHVSETPKLRSTGDDKWVASEESLQWTTSKIATYNVAQRLFRCTECECVGFLSRVAEHWLGTHANLRVFQCPNCPYASAWARCVRMHLQRQHNVADPGENATGMWKENPVLEEVTKYLQRLKNRAESLQTSPGSMKTEFTQSPPVTHQISPPNRTSTQPAGTENTPSKRYCCSYCPYATDRRDLFTRHENIHRDEKPFQCYVCQKQFNRADHVKKHFLRMHRDHPYDLNRIRRQPGKSPNGITYYHKYPTQTHPRPTNVTSPGQGHLGLNIPAGFAPPQLARGIKATSPHRIQNGCNAKSHGSKNGKKRGEKRYSCCYCAWSGVDNWCLKRHLNTHLKPFVCALCDYKAARSERLATHVLKVHNKRACSRCSFLAEDSAQIAMHMQEHHPLEQRSGRTSGNVLRAANFTNLNGNPSFSLNAHDSSNQRRSSEESGGLWTPHSNPLTDDTWKPKHFGAARLFHYMEASDTSEPENEPEEEPPPFICRECGCEFVDDTSLETHVFMHHRSSNNSSSGHNTGVRLDLESSKHTDKYEKSCSAPRDESPGGSKRQRKQEQPRRVMSEENKEIVTALNSVESCKRNRHYFHKLRIKHITNLVLRLNRRCFSCPQSKNNLFPYHTKASLALHKLWKHRTSEFLCEHCPEKFRHRYQIVLHGSRVHRNQNKQLEQPAMPLVLLADQENAYLITQTDSQMDTAPTLLACFSDLQPALKANFLLSHSRTLQELNSNKSYHILNKAGPRSEVAQKKMPGEATLQASYKLLELSTVGPSTIHESTHYAPPSSDTNAMALVPTPYPSSV